MNSKMVTGYLQGQGDNLSTLQLGHRSVCIAAGKPIVPPESHGNRKTVLSVRGADCSEESLLSLPFLNYGRSTVVLRNTFSVALLC